MKYAYLLQNEYPTISSLSKAPAPTATSRNPTPAVDALGEPLPTEGTTETNGRDVSPAPTFGGRVAANESSISKGPRKPIEPPKFMDREMNVGMFGVGGGDFDPKGNMRTGPMAFDGPPGISPTLS